MLFSENCTTPHQSQLVKLQPGIESNDDNHTGSQRLHSTLHNDHTGRERLFNEDMWDCNSLTGAIKKIKAVETLERIKTKWFQISTQRKRQALMCSVQHPKLSEWNQPGWISCVVGFLFSDWVKAGLSKLITVNTAHIEVYFMRVFTFNCKRCMIPHHCNGFRSLFLLTTLNVNNCDI